jgi:vacuolar-type H+-ATPase subunit H
MPKTAAQLKAHAQFMLPTAYELREYYRNFLNDLQQQIQSEKRDEIIAKTMLTIQDYTNKINTWEQDTQA